MFVLCAEGGSDGLIFRAGMTCLMTPQILWGAAAAAQEELPRDVG